MTKQGDTVQSVERAIDLLYCFSIGQPDLSINDFVKKTGLKRTTVFRLLNSLKEKDLIIKNNDTGLYHLGLPFVGFGQIVSETLDVRKEALPVLKSISKQTNETVSLNIVQANRRVCVEKADGQEDIRQFVRLGYPYPLVKGASGKVLLAHLAPDFIEDSICDWEEENSSSISREDYLKELEEIRQSGVAISKNERVFGAYSISAPILDASNQLTAGLSMSGLVGRLDNEMENEYMNLIKEGAREISWKMGYTKIKHF